MRHGSLFSGGGGFDLAAELLGWQNIFHCEEDQFCQTILKHYWPNAHSASDIKEFDGRPFRGTIDILTGGFPCQPFSVAGKRRGTEDDRYLWPEMLRIIKEVRPRWIVGENVYGLVNWNEGMVFDQVLSDLEAQGYEVSPLLLPAAGVNAPHQRYRVWIVGHNPRYAASESAQAHPNTSSTGRRGTKPCKQAAEGRDARKRKQADGLCAAELDKAHSNTYGYGRKRLHGDNEKQSGKRRKYAQRNVEPLGEHAAYADSSRLERRKASVNLEEDWEEAVKQFARLREFSKWSDWPTQSPLCGRDDGLPRELDGITLSKWRTQSIKLYGNAIVPQVAVMIFRAIEQFEQQTQGESN